MTPKEKANELVDKFIAAGCLFANAKQCALIAVEECMQCAYSMYDKGFEHSKEYWNEVKTEIQKL